MTRIQKLEKLQSDIVDSIGERGTAEIATGVGKTFIGFKWLLKYVPKYSKVHFFAETTVREKTLMDEARKFEEIYGIDIMSIYDIKFVCYQSIPVTDSIAHIYDEIHDMLTPVYQACWFNNQPKYCIGLSAFIPNIPLDKLDFDSPTKHDLLNCFAPIKYRYPISQAVEEGILSPFEISVKYYEFDNKLKNMLGGTKAKPVQMTEYEYFKFFDTRRKNFMMNHIYRGVCGKRVSDLLQSTKSPVPIAKQVLENPARTIIFGVDIDVLLEITPNVISSRNSKVVNQKIIDDFNAGKINTIGSFKMLKQGITLEGVERVLLVSYYSTEVDFLQRLGRGVRWVEDKIAKVIILKHKTSEMQDKWFNTMLGEFDKTLIKYE